MFTSAIQAVRAFHCGSFHHISSSSSSYTSLNCTPLLHDDYAGVPEFESGIDGLDRTFGVRAFESKCRDPGMFFRQKNVWKKICGKKNGKQHKDDADTYVCNTPNFCKSYFPRVYRFKPSELKKKKKKTVSCILQLTIEGYHGIVELSSSYIFRVE